MSLQGRSTYLIVKPLNQGPRLRRSSSFANTTTSTALVTGSVPEIQISRSIICATIDHIKSKTITHCRSLKTFSRYLSELSDSAVLTFLDAWTTTKPSNFAIRSNRQPNQACYDCDRLNAVTRKFAQC